MIRRLFKIFTAAIILSLVAIVSCNWIIKEHAKPLCYAEVLETPVNKVGLLLGTSPYFANQYFKYRVDAAVLLFNSGKIKIILVSGDNHIEGYDEPTAMKKMLLSKGIPDSCIVLDYAGFRTLDSIVRCKEVFGQDEFTIISQEFHNERALFIAHKYGINAIGYNAQKVGTGYGFKTSIREYLARVKCIVDLYLLNTQPHFLGEKIILPN